MGTVGNSVPVLNFPWEHLPNFIHRVMGTVFFCFMNDFICHHRLFNLTTILLKCLHAGLRKTRHSCFVCIAKINELSTSQYEYQRLIHRSDLHTGDRTSLPGCHRHKNQPTSGTPPQFAENTPDHQRSLNSISFLSRHTNSWL